MAKYDYFSGGLDELLIDIETLKMDIKSANLQMVKDLSIETDLAIKRNAKAETELDVGEIIASNKVSPIMINGEMVMGSVYNSSEAATYAEFGYGIIGKDQPYVDFNFFDGSASSLGDWTYDVKGHGLKGWWYTNKMGVKRRSVGTKAHHTFYNAYKDVSLKVEGTGVKAFQNLKLGGKGQ